MSPCVSAQCHRVCDTVSCGWLLVDSPLQWHRRAGHDLLTTFHIKPFYTFTLVKSAVPQLICEDNGGTVSDSSSRGWGVEKRVEGETDRAGYFNGSFWRWVNDFLFLNKRKWFFLRFFFFRKALFWPRSHLMLSDIWGLRWDEIAQKMKITLVLKAWWVIIMW